jgi:aminopeptidase-like protein
MQHTTHQALPRAPRADLKMNTVIPEAEPTVLVANILGKQHFHLVARRGNTMIDRAVVHTLRHSGLTPSILDFSPYGYDERQYCSPGFNLPVGLFQRSKFGEIPQYHTSADNLDFIAPDHLAASYRMITEVLNVIENDAVYRNTMPKCEPQLGRRGLYGMVGGDKNAAAANMAMLWVLNLSDGMHSLLDIAERAALPFAMIQRTAQLLKRQGLLTICDTGLDELGVLGTAK